jgi:hypothetical protein
MLAASGLLSAWIDDYKSNPPQKKTSDELAPAKTISNQINEKTTSSLRSVTTYPLILSSGSISNLRSSTGASPNTSPASTPEKNMQKTSTLSQ